MEPLKLNWSEWNKIIYEKKDRKIFSLLTKPIELDINNKSKSFLEKKKIKRIVDE